MLLNISRRKPREMLFEKDCVLRGINNSTSALSQIHSSGLKASVPAICPILIKWGSRRQIWDLQVRNSQVLISGFLLYSEQNFHFKNTQCSFQSSWPREDRFSLTRELSTLDYVTLYVEIIWIIVLSFVSENNQTSKENCLKNPLS